MPRRELGRKAAWSSEGMLAGCGDPERAPQADLLLQPDSHSAGGRAQSSPLLAGDISLVSLILRKEPLVWRLYQNMGARAYALERTLEGDSYTEEMKPDR